jgi:hypothetical protein
MSEITHADIAAMVTRIEGKLETLGAEVAKTREIVEAWQAVKTGGKAITWLAKLLAATVLFVGMFKVGVAAMIEWSGK